VVDDDPVMLQNLEIIFGSIFDEVFTACNPLEAEAVLRVHPISHLICDYELGEGVLPGTLLIAGWRRSYPKLRKTVLFTATLRTSIEVPPEVDTLMSKRAPVETLIAELKD